MSSSLPINLHDTGMVLRKEGIWDQRVFLVGDYGESEWVVFR